MKILDIGYEEASQVYESDIAINHEESQDFDLPPEKQKIAQAFVRTGTRVVKKNPEKEKSNKTVYNFSKRERKPNATKEGIIAEIAQFFSNNSQFAIENLSIPNKQGKISFSIGGTNFSITLTQHRK